MGELIGLLFGPQWFYTEALGIDLVSAAVLVLTALASVRYCSHAKNKRKFHQLTWAFSLIAAAFVLKAFLGVLAHFRIVSPESPFVALVGTILGVGGVGTLIVFVLYHALTLAGFYVLYSIYHKQDTQNTIAWLYFLTLVIFVSIGANFVFHLTIALMLSFIIYNYINKYKKSKNRITRQLAIGFGIIALSHFLFIFKFYVELYLVAELLQLIGYITLLSVLVMIKQHGKKTITNRHHT